jgi:alkylation response protein AidB-like acyl-CoA dehydrogenase
MSISKITSPADSDLTRLAVSLRELADCAGDEEWPSEQLAMCGECGVFEWFFSPDSGGQGWSDADIFRGYLELSAACLTTVFVITQRTGACRRIEVAESDAARDAYLPGLLSGEVFATVGISHLTTSRRHLAKPVLRAEQTPTGFVLDGFSPWVTGAAYADVVVTGATMDDGHQILVALPMDLGGVFVPAAARLVGLSGSQTGPIELDRVQVDSKWLLAGPTEGVMSQASGANTGGLQTSALAIGLARAAIAFIEEESTKRADLTRPADTFREDWSRLRDDLLRLADGEPVCSNDALRTNANNLVLRATQAALATAKGTGYLANHSVGRWCKESLFFLVWSCPQSVMNAHLCELAGISD